MPSEMTVQFLQQAALRVGLDAVVMLLLVGVIYRRGHRQSEFVFTYLVTNAVTLAAMMLMSTAEMGIGVGLGLLAIFGIFRYRTTEVDVVALSYLFVSVGVAVVNGFMSPVMDIWAATALSTMLLVALAVAEFVRSRTGTSDHRLVYDRLELLAPDRRTELEHDLRQRLGFACRVLSIGDVDLLKEVAHLKIRSTRESS